MPLHTIYCPTSMYSSSEKQDIVNAITDLYHTGRPGGPPPLPDFFVVVNFIPSENLYMGYKHRPEGFVRIVVQHVAVAMSEGEEGKKMKNGFMEAYSKLWKPFTLDRGISYEADVIQNDQDLWRIDGFKPPSVNHDPEGIKKWYSAGKPVALE